jgi:lipopolysaccharide/colanic/teichoic acid biosynthesis glycosyltransferase
LFKPWFVSLISNLTMEGSTFFHTHVHTTQHSDLASDVKMSLPFLLDEQLRKRFRFEKHEPQSKSIPHSGTSRYCETRMNDVRRINKYLEEVNESLEIGQLFIGSFETYRARRNRITYYRIPLVKHVWIASEFIFLRIFPKVPLLKQVYFATTGGKGRLLSKAEMLGRLVCCGFEIVANQSIGGMTWFAAKKIKAPSYDKNPSYGPIFKMRRIGKGGRIFHVLKFRTMHPYSEYLQDYVLKMNGYAESGKPADDFRLTPWGKFMRRYWLDELPQLINVLSGDMKLVGVRPVSPRYFQDIPKHLQELRVTQKPGCIPPYVALDRKPSVEGVLKAEEEYLTEKKQNPYFTDTRYFFRAIYNIIVKRKRSA